MPLELNKVKKQIQDHLQEGLLIIVGTGPSIAEGISGMRSLAEHLKKVMPLKMGSTPDPEWDNVVVALDRGDHLEAAMGKTKLHPRTIEVIVAETSALIIKEEQQIFERVLGGVRILPFTPFLKHIFKAGKKFHLITTNYDRLIELAAEAAEIGVDTRFVGYLHGRSDPKRSADAHRESYISGKNYLFHNLQCLCIHKPHGSLDWYHVDGKIVRCSVYHNLVPVIITPGTSKYRESFRWAFDDQRTAGNKAASIANKLMFIGYGFNDDHLEQYLCPNLKVTKPTVIVTKQLSDNAKKVVVNNQNINVIALSAVSETDHRTRIITQNGEETIVDEQLWDLEGFNKGVL